MFESNTSIFAQINSPPEYSLNQRTWRVIGEACFVFLLIYFGDKAKKWRCFPWGLICIVIELICT